MTKILYECNSQIAKRSSQMLMQTDDYSVRKPYKWKPTVCYEQTQIFVLRLRFELRFTNYVEAPFYAFDLTRKQL